MLEVEERVTERENLCVSPTEQETSDELVSLRNNKSVAQDNISAELIQNGGEGLISRLSNLLKEVWHRKKFLRNGRLISLYPYTRKVTRQNVPIIEELLYSVRSTRFSPE